MTISLIDKIPVCCSYHPCKTYSVCLHRSQLYILRQFSVLLAYTGSIEKQVHATQLIDKSLECFSCIACRYVDSLYGIRSNTL